MSTIGDDARQYTVSEGTWAFKNEIAGLCNRYRQEWQDFGLENCLAAVKLAELDIIDAMLNDDDLATESATTPEEEDGEEIS